MSRLWLVLFMLFSTLSSNPLGSMEQHAPGWTGPLAQATASTPVRLLDEEVTAHEPLQTEPQPDDSQHAHPPLGSLEMEPILHRTLDKQDPPPSADPHVSLLERLPYYPNAPPVVSTA